MKNLILVLLILLFSTVTGLTFANSPPSEFGDQVIMMTDAYDSDYFLSPSGEEMGICHDSSLNNLAGTSNDGYGGVDFNDALSWLSPRGSNDILLSRTPDRIIMKLWGETILPTFIDDITMVETRHRLNL